MVIDKRFVIIAMKSDFIACVDTEAAGETFAKILGPRLDWKSLHVRVGRGIDVEIVGDRVICETQVVTPFQFQHVAMPDVEHELCLISAGIFGGDRLHDRIRQRRRKIVDLEDGEGADGGDTGPHCAQHGVQHQSAQNAPISAGGIPEDDPSRPNVTHPKDRLALPVLGKNFAVGGKAVRADRNTAVFEVPARDIAMELGEPWKELAPENKTFRCVQRRLDLRQAQQGGQF